MKNPQLPALEKNVMKYRALQMVLLLHEFESLRRFVIESIRVSDRFRGTEELPVGCKKPFEVALDLLVAKNVIGSSEKTHLLEYARFRNRIGHEIYTLVADVSGPKYLSKPECVYDYHALNRLERLRDKISRGMMSEFVMSLSFEGLIFEQAELTYKEELSRLHKRIERQMADRSARLAPNNSFRPTRLHGAA
jgi:hypothetical protein